MSFIIFSGGIPVSPADLDFGSSLTKDQINALSAFSQMVNAIPTPPYDVWVPSGSLTWDEYNLVLTQAEFPSASANVASTSVAGAAVGTTPRPTLSRAVVNHPPPAQDVWSEFEARGFEFEGAVPAAFPEPDSAISTSGVSISSAPGLAATFAQLEARLVTDRLTDTLGNQFYPTRFYPPDFYSAANDAMWRTFQVNPGDNNPWAPLAQGGSVTGQLVIVPLQRPWWSPWVFSNRGWRFQPSSGLPALSDGGQPPNGTMPAYASSLAVARNLRPVNPPPAGPSQPTGTQMGPRPALIPPEAASSMLIIGFLCVPLVQCPNPDPSLTWPAN